MKKFLFIVFMLLSVNQIFASTADILCEDPWRVLQNKFETKPEKWANSWKNIGTKVVGAVGGGCSAFSVLGFIHSRFFNNNYSLKYLPKLNASKLEKGLYFPIIPTAILSGLITHSVIDQVLIRKYQKQELFDLLKNWDKYKDYIPHSLVNKLNKVRQDYLQNRAEIENESDEILDVIVSEINLHFYGDAKARNLFDIRTLSANFNTHFVLDLAKIIDSIVKAYTVYNNPGNAGTHN